ncbi:hypothetical protein FLA_5076 [Filimonas lacunae]|nr:hypothetical protein FLA_5076 [Filimonas lacunae]
MPLQLQQINREGYSVSLWVPDAAAVQASYYHQKEQDNTIPFPHWTRLWPAALALTDYLHTHPELIRQKNVLELAAGLGLPSLIAARQAATVCCSDYLQEAVDTMEQNIRHNQLTNVTGSLINWHHLPPQLQPDVLLMSDINYNPEDFSHLYQVLLHFLQMGTHIILTTPQRLMAKPFIEQLLPWCVAQQEVNVQDTQVTILELSNQH